MRQGASGRALIVGGDSLVGSALQAHCRKAGISVDLTSRRPGAGGIPLDLGNPDFAPLARADYQTLLTASTWMRTRNFCNSVAAS